MKNPILIGNLWKIVEKCNNNRTKAAQIFGVSRQAFDDWLNNKSSPRAVNLLTFAKNSGESIDWLLTGKTPSPLDLSDLPEDEKEQEV